MTPMTPDPKPTSATDGMVEAWRELAVNKWQEFIPVEVINRLVGRIESDREKIATMEVELAKLREERDALENWFSRTLGVTSEVFIRSLGQLLSSIQTRREEKGGE